MGEHLPCKQGVKGSNPFISMKRKLLLRRELLLNPKGCCLYLENRIPNQRSKSRNKQKSKRKQAEIRRPAGSATLCTTGSSRKRHGADALALGADERRNKLRKAAGRSRYPKIRRCLNGETRRGKPPSPYTESIGVRREPGELKHLSNRRKRKQQ